MKTTRLCAIALGAAMMLGSTGGALAMTVDGFAPDVGDFVTAGDRKWGPGPVGTGATISYSFMNAGISMAGDAAASNTTDLANLLGNLNAFKNMMRSAFDAWEAVANLTFVEVADSGNAFDTPGAAGDIRIGAHSFDGPSNVLAHAYFPPPNGNSAAGDLHFDSDDLWELVSDGTGDGVFNIFQVAMHEIGHSIGLNHTNVPNSLMNAFYSEAFLGPQADDIAGAQYLYGVPVNGNPIPLPAALPLLGGGILLMGFVGRRKRRAA